MRYRKAADMLKPDGFLALWGAGHVIPYVGDPFFEELQEIYDEIGESLPRMRHCLDRRNCPTTATKSWAAGSSR